MSLTAKEYALLEYLARRAGDVVSRADIAEHVWDEHYDPLSNVVDVYVQRLRRKLDQRRIGVADPHAPRRRLSARGRRRRRAMNELSLRLRLTVWYTLALLVALCLGGGRRLCASRAGVGMRRVDRELDALAGTLQRVLRDELTGEPGRRRRRRGGAQDGDGAGPGGRDSRRARPSARRATGTV